MLFLFAAIIVPVLIISKYWHTTIELLRLAHYAFTPTITPPPALALIDATTTSLPSPLAIVGKVSDSFASDFALALCGMAAFMAFYVFGWGALRFDLCGKIKDGAVLVARRLLGRSSGAVPPKLAPGFDCCLCGCPCGQQGWFWSAFLLRYGVVWCFSSPHLPWCGFRRSYCRWLRMRSAASQNLSLPRLHLPSLPARRHPKCRRPTRCCRRRAHLTWHRDA
ncbi:hypothetical protein DM01DRAFT_1377321 [Hesseltinella vesiculosa]|uniref:Uncharacterized protein n=1 Tax=Hesseltinella vesiculosa TaxID=101127 RepID=A0A1X2G7S5_9FUNG|nr:hypothetical protein DM01DRAFT_1377321 [Hesseltinella vesiculosa]